MGTHLERPLLSAQFAGVGVKLRGQAFEAIAHVAGGVGDALGEAGAPGPAATLALVLIRQGVHVILAASLHFPIHAAGGGDAGVLILSPGSHLATGKDVARQVSVNLRFWSHIHGPLVKAPGDSVGR